MDRSRDEVEEEFGKLTDFQWMIIVNEVDNRDPDEESEVVAYYDVMDNLGELEEDYRWFKEQMKAAKDDSQEADGQDHEETKLGWNEQQARNIVFSWFTEFEDPTYEPYDRETRNDGFFFGFANRPSEVGEQQILVKRPSYVHFGSSFVFFDIPFCFKDSIEDLSEELGPWGIGWVGSAYTYHLVFTYEQIVKAPESTLNLLAVVLYGAAERDYELTGEIAYQVESES